MATEMCLVAQTAHAHHPLWAAGQPQHLSKTACSLIDDADNELLFSAASLWEVAIKSTLGRGQ